MMHLYMAAEFVPLMLLKTIRLGINFVNCKRCRGIEVLKFLNKLNIFLVYFKILFKHYTTENINHQMKNSELLFCSNIIITKSLLANSLVELQTSQSATDWNNGQIISVLILHLLFSSTVQLQRTKATYCSGALTTNQSVQEATKDRWTTCSESGRPIWYD